MSDSTEPTVQQAREIVLKIARKKGWISQRARENSDPETLEALACVREELGDVVETIARDIYSQKARFVLELIQNAEDNHFIRARDLGHDPSITFEVYPTRIIVECNEDGFTEDNVDSICRTGKSSKKYKRGYIGEKGIGFKSVFQVASKVHIQSNSFSFSFQYDEGATAERVKSDKLGIITPIWEDEILPLGDRPLTRMTLTPKSNLPYNALVTQFEDIPDDLLLFLSNIKKLAVKIHYPDERVTVTTFHKSVDLITRMTSLIKTTEDPDDPEPSVKEDRYYIVTRPMSGLPADNARPDIDECEVVLAFPLEAQSFSPLIGMQNVFAFLPIRKVGFSFLIQADFILGANRQDVVDSPRNKKILEGVALAFCDAVLQFCRSDSPLRHQWMRFLPSDRALDTFWNQLPPNIINLLKEEDILYPHECLVPCKPSQLRTLPISHLYNGLPLFEDRPGVNMTYLSLEYDPRDRAIIQDAFNLDDIEDWRMFHRIKQDVYSSRSKLKDLDGDDDWHTRASDLILSILNRTPTVGREIRGLHMIPLINGTWVNTSPGNLYFPAEIGPEIPSDLIVTIDPRAVRNESKKKLLQYLGVAPCQPAKVLELLSSSYSREDGGAADLPLSKTHVSYLYWHEGSIDDHKFPRLWIYDREGFKVTSRQKLIYFQSEDEYGPQQLLKAEQHPTSTGRNVPECAAQFLDSEYMDLFPSTTRQHGLSWRRWLERELRVRRIPRLKSHTGALSIEFEHIIRYRPEKVIGTLKTHWDTYESELSETIVERLSHSEVACLGRHPEVLSSTYLPLRGLKDEVQKLGIGQEFPFLKLPVTPEEGRLLRDWRFLEEFGVGLKAELNFYVEILRQHVDRRHQSWGLVDRHNILKTYESIADHCSDSDKNWLLQVQRNVQNTLRLILSRDEFFKQNLILHPSSFSRNASGPIWIDVESCFWGGPADLLDKTPLASVPQYKNNRILERFFCRFLDVEDANWKDYLNMLVKLRGASSPQGDVFGKVLGLYQHISRVSITGEAWTQISDSFEEHGLIYMPTTSSWFSPSDCLWASPVPIEGKAILANSYPEDLGPFFLQRLQITAASLGTLVDGLHTLSQRNPTLLKVNQMIWAINKRSPEQEDLEKLLTCNFLPVKVPRPGADDEVSFQNCQTDFAIIDRTKLARIFQGQVSFLNFELEEVLELQPFLNALGISNKYLTSICREETACDEEGSIDSRLTAEFRDRAYDFLRCAVSLRSPNATRNPRSVYERLLTTSIFKTDGISTKFTLHQSSGTKTVRGPQGYVYVRIQDGMWQILVPQRRRDREFCYSLALPEALTKLFQIDLSARELLGNILNRPMSIIDNILEAQGIGMVRDIPPPRRPSFEEETEEEAEEEAENEAIEEVGEEERTTIEEVEASPRNARAQSAPLPALRNILSQIDLTMPPAVETEQLGSPRDTVDTPASSPSRDSPPPHPRPRRLSPESVNQWNDDTNYSYRNILDDVIRIAHRTSLPHHSFRPGVGGVQFHQGFDHEAAFGIRSQGQMDHDIRVGAAGELFAFEILSRLSLPGFSRDNWASTIRTEVTIHPRYNTMGAWPGHRETADITYDDTDSVFTSLLIEKGYLQDQVWRGARPKYFIEVKTTIGEFYNRLFLSNGQFTRMQNYTLTPGQTAPNIYIIFRVFNLSRDSLNVKLYVDPEAHRLRGDLVFESQNWTVRPRRQ